MVTIDQLKTGGRIAVLYGGRSAERSVSLESGSQIAEHLQQAGYRVDLVDLNANAVEQIQQAKPDFCFIALHGGDGENGTVQALLDLLEIPYTGSGVLGAAIAMDKVRSKQLWQSQELPTPPFAVLSTSEPYDATELLAQLGGRVVVKPSTEGSSVGMSLAGDAESLQVAIGEAAPFASTILVEQYIAGPEYTVAIVDGHELPSIGISTSRDFYDFHAKYEDDATRFDVPSDLNIHDERDIQALASKAFAALGCSGWGRIDVMRDAESGRFYLLEANTVPGMTSHSLVPMAGRAAGLGFTELLERIIERGLQRR